MMADLWYHQDCSHKRRHPCKIVQQCELKLSVSSSPLRQTASWGIFSTWREESPGQGKRSQVFLCIFSSISLLCHPFSHIGDGDWQTHFSKSYLYSLSLPSFHTALRNFYVFPLECNILHLCSPTYAGEITFIAFEIPFPCSKPTNHHRKSLFPYSILKHAPS